MYLSGFRINDFLNAIPQKNPNLVTSGCSRSDRPQNQDGWVVLRYSYKLKSNKLLSINLSFKKSIYCLLQIFSRLFVHPTQKGYKIIHKGIYNTFFLIVSVRLICYLRRLINFIYSRAPCKLKKMEENNASEKGDKHKPSRKNMRMARLNQREG